MKCQDCNVNVPSIMERLNLWNKMLGSLFYAYDLIRFKKIKKVDLTYICNNCGKRYEANWREEIKCFITFGLIMLSVAGLAVLIVYLLSCMGLVR
ncbi:MAG: hypothetical protein A2W23_03945 [Planctomycetes bacterium RBG_16_43_13]|nr:MAG: hypothetical protein A2W23_03945 [Planctomycetes bacterium RBG_16_43_13]